jgi:hypothetical protein
MIHWKGCESYRLRGGTGEKHENSQAGRPMP